MDKIARLRQEIERRYAEYRAKMKTDDFTYYEGMADALDLFEQFLDTLSEESDKSLEEEIERYLPQIPEEPNNEELRVFARHFAQWQKQQMLKDAVEVTVQSPLLGPPMVCCIASGCSDGDKVRIVVLKGEEE